jgi:hypothetical protein
MRARFARFVRCSSVFLLAACVGGQASAQSLSGVRAGLAAPHAIHDAAARQQPPLRPFRQTGRTNSEATKVTAGFAMGFVGIFAGMATAYMIAVATKAPGSGQTAEMTGAIVGGIGGAALGVWLASR